MYLRRTGFRHIKRQCFHCGHVYGTGFLKHVREMHFLASGGDLKMDRLPVQPFYGHVWEVDQEVHIQTLYKQPKKRYHLIEKLASLMRNKFAIPKQYWRLAADAAYKHECISGRLPKARKQMS